MVWQTRGLVSRRTALRQAESLKGHGYTIGKSIIGRDLKEIIEIEERKIGMVPDVTLQMKNLWLYFQWKSMKLEIM